MVLLILILVVPINAQNPVCGFSYKKTITIQGSQVVGGPHVDFPVLVSHTDPDLAQSAGKVTNANGFDIIFADDSGNPLDFQLEEYDGTTGQYVAWIRLPSLTNGIDVDIHMLYGKTTISSDQSTDAIWSSNYQAVWHLNDDFLDHTSTSYDGVNNGSTDVVAKIADGQNFVDPNHWIEVPSFPNLTTNFTISGWIYTNDNTQAGQRIFADDASNSGGFALSVGDPGAGRIRFYARGTGPVSLDSPAGIISNNTWHYCVAVADISNSVKRIFVDGVEVASGGFSGTWGTDVGNASIGGETASGETANRFFGDLDEIRVANSALTANWIATEYNSQNQPILSFGSSNLGDFYAVGTEEDIFHTSAGSGDWDQNGTWDSGEVPDGQFENVVILNSDVDIDGGSSDYTICNCNISKTAAGNTFLDVGSSRVLTVLGDLDVDHGSSDENNLRLLVNGSATVNVAGNMTWISTNTNNGSDLQLLLRDDAEVDVSGTFNLSNTSGDDLSIDLEDNSQLNITEDLSIAVTGGDDINLFIDDASSVTVGGNLLTNHSGGDGIRIRLNSSSGIAGQLIISGNINANRSGGDEFELSVNQDNSIVTVAQDFSIVSTGGGAVSIDLNNDATIQVDGIFSMDYFSTSDAEIDLEANPSNPTFSVGGAIDLTLSGGDGRLFMDINGGTFSTGSDLIASNVFATPDGDLDLELDGDAQLLVAGNLAVNLIGGDDIWFDIGTQVSGSTAEMIISGDATFTQSQAGTGNLARLLVFENTRFEVQGELTWTNSIASSGLMLLNLANSAQLTVQNDINLNAQNDGDIEIRLEDTSELQIGGNFVRQASPSNYGYLNSAATATVEYNGTSSQLFAEDDGAGSDEFNYGLVEVNNSSGTSPQLTMEGLATVNGGIIFIDGVIATTATDILVIENGASTSGASNVSHVDGWVRKIGNTPASEFSGIGYAFPVGDDNNYQPIFISAPGASDQFDAQYLEQNPHPTYDNTQLDPTIDRISGVEYWLLETPGTPSVTVRLSWDTNSGGVGNLGDLLVARWNGSTWIDEGNGGTTGSTAGGTVVSAAPIGSFSPFTLASTSPQNALPIELAKFQASVVSNEVLLEWTTLSETNNDFFTIERSKDTQEWEEVITLAGAGNSVDPLTYSTRDIDPYFGTSYYRLKQTDFDGTFSYSPIEKVLLRESDEVSVHPVPSRGQVILSAEVVLHPDQVTVYNSFGQAVQPRIIQTATRVLSLDFAGLASGTYYIRWIGSSGRESFRVVIID